MEEFEIEFKKEDNGIIREIIFSGDLLLSSQGRVKEVLSVLDLSACNKLKISFADQVELDLSFLQVLFSFIKKLESQGIVYTIDWPEDAELMKLIESSGLSGVFKLQQ